MKNLEKKNLNNKLALIVMAFIVIIVIMKVITLRSASYYKKIVAFVRTLIIIRINA